MTVDIASLNTNIVSAEVASPHVQKSDEEAIKTMQLYSNVERIDNELRALGIQDGSHIDPLVLNKFDSLHYEGNDTIRAAIDALQINSSSKVLDIGSGFGGPARVLAMETNCNVVAIELQNDLHQKALDLTSRCNLDEKVRHIQGDILDSDASEIADDASFDAIVSWLVFLHIKDKKSLFDKCYQKLKDDGSGKLYCDDFFLKDTLAKEQAQSLEKNVYCTQLPTREEYITTLTNCGFDNIQFEERTECWTDFTKNRLQKFVANRDRFVEIHSVGTYDNLLHFYTAMVELFGSGKLGGVRIIAEKKKKKEEEKKGILSWIGMGKEEKTRSF